MMKKVKSVFGVMIILTLFSCGCTDSSVTWQEAYNTYIHEGLELCLEGMNTSIMEFCDEYSSDQCDLSTGEFLEDPVLKSSNDGENLDVKTYRSAQQEMNISEENTVDWWSDATLISETFFS